MDTKKWKQFKILNQMNIYSTSFACASCDSWLTKQIFLHPDGTVNMNYCRTCSLLLKSDSRRNRALEDVLENLLFPCKYANCDFILKKHMFDDHVVNCIHAPNGCSLCDQTGMSLTEYEDHLKTKHADKIIKLDKPVLNLMLNEPTKNDIIIATFHDNIFLCHITLKECMLSVNVAKVTKLCDQNIRYHFNAYCRYDAVKKMFEKIFIVHSNVSINSNYNAADIMVDVGKTLSLEIFLCDFEKALLLAACPICAYDVGVEVYQCVNGHNVCDSCGAKITKCACCRSSDIKPVKLRYLFPNSLMLCSNFEKGCLVASKGDDFVTHVETCVYSHIKCVVCDAEVLKCNIMSHMYEMHAMDENMKLFSIPLRFEREVTDVQFKNQAFRFSCVIGSFDDEKTIVFRVRLLYNENIAKAQKYKYEIHILADDSYMATHILKGVCQAECDVGSSWIYYNTCAELSLEFDDDKDEDELSKHSLDNVKRLNVRYVILDV